jgi:hypothetical protein
MAGQGGQAMGAPATVDPGGDDRLRLVDRQRSRRASRSGTAIEEARVALGSVAAQPLVRGRPADPLHRGRVSDRPAKYLDPGDQELPAEDRQLRPRMCHESLLSVWSLNTPNRSGRLSFVNNLSGNYT